MRDLLKQTFPTKSITFLNKKNALQIRKLSGLEVEEFQRLGKEAGEGAPDAEKNSALVRFLINKSVVGAEDLTSEEIKQFPLDDVNNLVTDLLAYSGIISKADEKGND